MAPTLTYPCSVGLMGTLDPPTPLDGGKMECKSNSLRKTGKRRQQNKRRRDLALPVVGDCNGLNENVPQAHMFKCVVPVGRTLALLEVSKAPTTPVDSFLALWLWSHYVSSQLLFQYHACLPQRPWTLPPSRMVSPLNAFISYRGHGALPWQQEVTKTEACVIHI